ncbi:MAG TPA: hypothetical protein ENK25_03035 [Bacteroidetes bacterium]|nr:hypothetical protein [Bacteroidota bacterium]
MKRKNCGLAVFFFFFPALLLAQNLYQVTVAAGDYDREDCPVFIPVSLPDNGTVSAYWHLYEKTHKGFIPVLCQQDHSPASGIWFILSGTTPRHTRRTFLLKRETAKTADTAIMKIQKTFSSYVLERGSQKILNYRFRIMAPPDGADPLCQKSGYIHPLWSPSGEVLTRIQPPDHPHHYGIWGPWTKTHINGREVDFWNLGKGQGTVRYAGLLSLEEGPVFCALRVHQKHIDFGTNGPDRIAINEILEMRAWNVGPQAWLVDYTSTQNCPLPSGILLEAYRYGGGLGFRATGHWNNKNSSVLTSEGKTRQDADGSKARWCRITGTMPSGENGILFMDHPENRDFPEPMRVWPGNANNGRGDLFFEFCPIRHKSWTIKKGKEYTLKYRMFIFHGKISREEAERLWNDFAHPPVVETEKIK